MSLLNRYLDGAYIAWLSSAIGCCSSQLEETPKRGVERPMTILHHQPSLVPPPLPEPQKSRASSNEWLLRTRSSSQDWMSRTKSFASRASARSSFSVRRKLNAYNGMRRPHIGAPTDFRHVQNALPRRTERFRPLELSIYLPENRLSPILPHFGDVDDEEQPILSYPPNAVLHSRSESALSNFSIPRKPVNGHKPVHGRAEGMRSRTTSSSWGSECVVHPLHPRPAMPGSPSAQELMTALQEELPQAPPQARLRANTEPAPLINRDSVHVDRVKLALLEKLELEQQLKDIDNMIEERRSIYLSSRANSVSYAAFEEPMPDLKTSELERMARPRTAPAKPNVHIPVRAKSFSEATATFKATEQDLPPPPPLPLVLHATRPPLRKKKSFSRVSSWLFPEHTRNISMESITNTPKPVTLREGFYQCVDNNARPRSMTTVSTLDSELEEPTAPTTWTPDSSPSTRAQKEFLELSGAVTMGEKEEGLVVTREFGSQDFPVRISRVGVAF